MLLKCQWECISVNPLHTDHFIGREIFFFYSQLSPSRGLRIVNNSRELRIVEK